MDIPPRDLAFLATFALLFAFTLELLALVRHRRDLEARLADAHAEIDALRERLADATRPPTLYARMHLREVAVNRFARLSLAIPRRSRAP